MVRRRHLTMRFSIQKVGEVMKQIRDEVYRHVRMPALAVPSLTRVGGSMAGVAGKRAVHSVAGTRASTSVAGIIVVTRRRYFGLADVRRRGLRGLRRRMQLVPRCFQPPASVRYSELRRLRRLRQRRGHACHAKSRRCRACLQFSFTGLHAFSCLLCCIQPSLTPVESHQKSLSRQAGGRQEKE